MMSFIAKRVVKRSVKKYSSPPSKIFPLLCPVREYEWLDGWECEMVYSESGFAEEDCIFKTKFPGEEEETIWVMTKRDPENHEVHIMQVTPGSRVLKMQIRLEDDLAGGTNAHFTSTYTALREQGNTFIDSHAEEEFKQAMVRMEKSMNYFLETGEKLDKLAAC